MSSFITCLPRQSRRIKSVAFAFCAVVLLVPTTGCLGLVSNLMHAVGADQVPAKFDGLRDSKIAIVTVTDSSQYSDDATARVLNQKLSEVLVREVKGLNLVRQDLIDKWRDTNGWESLEFTTMGKELGADKVLVVEVTNMKLRDGATLYRGKSDAKISVYDVETGLVPFTSTIDEYTFPRTAGQYTSETTEIRFRKLYLTMMAQQIGRLFHPYDMNVTVAQDGKIAGL